MFNVWDISGSHSQPEDRAKWLKNSDAAIIMVDLAQKSSVDNAITWYRMLFPFFTSSSLIKLLGEIVSTHQDPSKLPIIIYAEKGYPDDVRYEVDPEAIIWPNEMENVQFYHTPYFDEQKSVKGMIEADNYYDRPFEWILQNIIGDPEVVCCI